MIRLTAILIAMAAAYPATALEVFACEPEWASLIREIAGENVNITTATTAFQDPHSLQARPSLIAAVRDADLLACTGADLEIGWLPLLLRRSGNPDIQPGSRGHFLAADYVRKLEIPKSVDRAQGDVHPQGNPHVHLHPRNVSRVADALAERLSQLDPGNASIYENRAESFQHRWDEATSAWETRTESLRGMRLASHHLSFSYLANWLDLDIVAVIESKPGIPPSGAQLSRLLEQLSPNAPRGVIRTPYENEKPSLWLSDRLNIPAILLPFTVGGNDDVVDLFSLYDVTIRTLEEHAD